VSAPGTAATPNGRPAKVHSEPRRPIVLVPGACLGGWSWQRVAGRLRALGHDVYPVTLTGLGERVHLASKDVDLDTHIADVVNLLDHEDLEDVVLVGHSYAGIVITGVADRRGARLDAVVYLDTGPVPDGAAIADVQSAEQRDRQRASVEEDGEGWRWPVPDRDTLATGIYGSVSGLVPSDLDLICSRGTAQPYATLTSPLRLRGPWPEQVRRVAIFCADGGMSLALLRDLIGQRDPRAGAFAAEDWELHELSTGHWAMLSYSGPLARLLHQVAVHSASRLA
jgi:pimeloyl-ACP methyl ester carboxylesterase